MNSLFIIQKVHCLTLSAYYFTRMFICTCEYTHTHILRSGLIWWLCTQDRESSILNLTTSIIKCYLTRVDKLYNLPRAYCIYLWNVVRNTTCLKKPWKGLNKVFPVKQLMECLAHICNENMCFYFLDTR